MLELELFAKLFKDTLSLVLTNLKVCSHSPPLALTYQPLQAIEWHNFLFYVDTLYILIHFRPLLSNNNSIISFRANNGMPKQVLCDKGDEVETYWIDETNCYNRWYD